MPVVMRQNLTTFAAVDRKIEVEAEAEVVVVVGGVEVKVEGTRKEDLERTIGVVGTRKQTWDVGSTSMFVICYSIDPAN